jgi:beta-mannosidase
MRIVGGVMTQTLLLDGSWRIRPSDFQRGRPAFAERVGSVDESRYVDANVPGSVHLDLMRAGLIADPRPGLNVLAARWVEEQVWSYRRVFDVPDPSARAWLVFDQIDGVGEVVLNGRKIASHANSFLPLRVEVTGMLRERDNVLAVHVESGLWHVADKPVHGWYHDNAKDQILHKRHWLRKVQSQTSWDWAPRLMNVGLGSVRLEFTRDPIRLDRFAAISKLDDDLKRGSVVAKAWVENLTGAPIDVTLDASVSGRSARVTASVKPGLHVVSTTIDVPGPALWWPVGHGAQTLHEVSATVAAGSVVLRAPTRCVGFRHVRVDQSKHPEEGNYFVLHVNHRPIFCKGANLVPADIIVAGIDAKRYDTLVDRAIEANFNLLRVWGGGLYEHDHFFDLCDQRGILVWQEFIYACSNYPLNDEAFLASATDEARHQLRRLSHHASLVIWCGNNEIETAIVNAWPGMNRGQVAPDYHFFHLTLPRICREEDGTRFYLPSSPFSPDGRNPGDHLAGDQHPWEIGFSDVDFRKYRQMKCRFPNEGGILGPTALPTMLECLAPGHEFVQSFSWQQHDNSVDSWAEPSYVDRLTDFWLGMDCRKMSIEQYTYWGGLVQAEGLREYIDNFRRRMFDSASAVFWMYNDTWPATRSWTIVDYRLRRTPSFHPVRRAFAPIHVVLAEVDDEIVVFGINETQTPRKFHLRYGVFTLDGMYPRDLTVEVELKPNASTPIARMPRAVLADPKRMVAFAILMQDGREVARNRLILPLFAEMHWSSAKVGVKVDAGVAQFTCATFAFNVCIDQSGDETSDNFFDVYPGIPTVMPWTKQTPPQVLWVGNAMTAQRHS